VDNSAGGRQAVLTSTSAADVDARVLGPAPRKDIEHDTGELDRSRLLTVVPITDAFAYDFDRRSHDKTVRGRVEISE